MGDGGILGGIWMEEGNQMGWVCTSHLTGIVPELEMTG